MEGEGGNFFNPPLVVNED